MKKSITSVLVTLLFLLAGASGQTFYANEANFFNSSVWTSAQSGANFTENFAASGSIHNFTGNEEFTSNSYVYGSGSLLNNVTYGRGDTPNKIFVDTSNETGGFLSFDNPGTSKYLYLPSTSGASLRITFSQGIRAFAFRLGDFGDASSGNSDLNIQAINAANSAIGYTLVNASGRNSLTVGSDTITTGNQIWAFMGWTFDSPVNEIRINQFVSNNDNLGIDTVSFSTVPEPSSASLLVLGIGGLMALRRARRS